MLGEIRERGPLGSRHFEGARTAGGMWNLKPAKTMLDTLWTSGVLAVAGRQGFQRLYDLSERVIPAEYLEAPIPTEQEFLREVTVWAVTARGALTESGVVEHARLKGGVARIRPHVDALVREGLLDRHEVDDGGAPVLVPAGTSFDAAPTAAVLISPFDNLLWDRPFARRVIGFDHLIEVYKPATRAPVRLLRAAAGGGRQDRRPGRSQSRPQGGLHPASGLPPRARLSQLPSRWSGRSTGWHARWA